MRRMFRSTPNLDQALAENTGLQINVFSKKLGTGSEGTVFLAGLSRKNQSPLFFAAKNRPLRNMASGDTAEHERELHYIATRHDQNARRQTGILPYIGTFASINPTNHREIYHAMPLAEGILHHCVPVIIELKTTNHTLYHAVIFDFLNSMLDALSQLSASQIVHNDLSTKNILLYKQRWVISDFGQAEKYAEFSSPDAHPRGSPLNIPPEILVQDKRFPLARDIWALGQILRALLGDKPMFHDTIPFGNVNAHIRAKQTRYNQLRQEQRQSEITVKDHQQSLQRSISQETTVENCLSTFIDSMSQILPEERPDLATFEMACNHLSRLLPTSPSHKDALTAFYTSIQNEELMVIHPISSPYSEEMTDESECEVVDLSCNSSCRSSPMLSHHHQP